MANRVCMGVEGHAEAWNVRFKSAHCGNAIYQFVPEAVEVLRPPESSNLEIIRYGTLPDFVSFSSHW
jgi:hypothetical protein